MLNDPKYSNAFIINNIPIPETNECTTFEDSERLLYEKASSIDFYNSFQVRHEYKTIVLPRLEEQQYQYITPPVAVVPQTQVNSLKETWDYASELYLQWSKYPEGWINRVYEYARDYLAANKYLNVSKPGSIVTFSRPGVMMGFATHPHLPIIALATATAVAICTVPLSHPVPKLLYHERVRGIKCVAFRPNAGNTVAVGYNDGIAIFTQKDEMVAKTTYMEGYHPGSASWVTFLADPQIGTVTSLSWDTYGEYIIAGSSMTGKVGVWRMNGKHFSLLSYIGPVEFVLWSPFDDFLFTSHADGILNFWDKSNKQEMTQMASQAAAFSPDGKYVAIATTNLYIYSLSHDKKEIVKCVFIEPKANIAVEKSNDKIELGDIENVAWSFDGQRIGISFSALPMIALYCVRKINDSFTLRPIGYVNPTSYSPDAPPHVHAISFIPNADRGSVLCVCYSNAIVTFTPLLYPTLTQPTKNQKVIIPQIRPVVFSQPAAPHIPLPLSPIPSHSPIPSGHILSPSKSTGYKVLFDNLRSPGFG